MGAYLSQPVTTKDSSDGASDAYAYGTTAMQGWRTNMEVRTTTTRGNDRIVWFVVHGWFVGGS